MLLYQTHTQSVCVAPFSFLNKPFTMMNILGGGDNRLICFEQAPSSEQAPIIKSE